MTDQPEALRLAQDLADYWEGMRAHHVGALHRCAVTLLREQYVEIERLRADADRYKYLKERVENYDGHACFPDVRYVAPIPDCSPFCPVDAAIDAAITEERKS